jgi:chemotaxis protein histidine kinase CheA
MNNQPRSPAELQEVIRKVHALRKVSKVMGFNTTHEIVKILEQLSADDLISIGEELKLKTREMPRRSTQVRTY